MPLAYDLVTENTIAAQLQKERRDNLLKKKVQLRSVRDILITAFKDSVPPSCVEAVVQMAALVFEAAQKAKVEKMESLELAEQVLHTALSLCIAVKHHALDDMSVSDALRGKVRRYYSDLEHVKHYLDGLAATSPLQRAFSFGSRRKLVEHMEQTQTSLFDDVTDFNSVPYSFFDLS